MKKFYYLNYCYFFLTCMNAQINIPDANFKAKLLQASPTVLVAKNLAGVYFRVDVNGDGEIQQSEASEVSYLTVTNSLISSIEGINSFNNLEFFYCFNNQLTTVNISGLNNLKTLDCSINPFMLSVNLSNLNSLETLYVENGNLTSLNLNLITSITRLFCTDNNLTSIDLSNLVNLNSLYCSQNSLSTLDVSASINLNTLNCSQNNLTSLFIKNGKNETTLLFSSNPNLKFICVDESQLIFVQNRINGLGYVNCFASSYCSFVPGGVFYTIQGNIKYDFNNNGCNETDANYPNLKFNISNGSEVGNLITNFSGVYSIPVLTGAVSLTPVLENPAYFMISPPTVNLTFPTDTSPLTQNFCVTPNGIHNDVEVIIVSSRARPGFDSQYSLLYKNKGNQTISGDINLTFNDAVLDFVSALPNVDNQAENTLTWNYTNLLPFESRIVNINLNVNSPMEIPAVNIGNILSFSATINPNANDETVIDNTFNLNQTVVGSYDPNDKTCLEGNTITPEMVGKYVHYLIRFENTGTDNAENVVVKDIIDNFKFDISTLITINASHNFKTRISNTNQVEFIFENIQLPFDDANNDGYIAFKIKTKPTLVL